MYRQYTGSLGWVDLQVFLAKDMQDPIPLEILLYDDIEKQNPKISEKMFKNMKIIENKKFSLVSFTIDNHETNKQFIW